MLIERVLNARTTAHPDGCDLVLAEGQVVDVTTTGTSTSCGGKAFDAAGRVVLPATVDAHVHLDKAYLLAEADALGDVTPGLAAAIQRVAALRQSLTPAVTQEKAAQAARALLRHGTTAARAHVEIDPDVGLSLVPVHRQVAADVPGLHLQLVAFPQRGLESSGMPQLLADALREGLDVVGGCPYVDADPGSHLDVVFALAERHSVPVDLHLDFTDDVTLSLIGQVAERTIAGGMQNRVTIGHVTTLAAMTPDQQGRAFDTLADAGIALVILPTTDLFLVGHGEPGTRSIAPYERALAAGVRTAIGNNNISNPFSPFGNANLLQAAWLAGLLRRTTTAEDRLRLLDAITQHPAAILELPARGTEVGQVADLAVLDCHDVTAAVLQAPATVATLVAGDLASSVPSPGLLAG